MCDHCYQLASKWSAAAEVEKHNFDLNNGLKHKLLLVTTCNAYTCVCFE